MNLYRSQLDVERIDRPAVQHGAGPSHKVRPLIAPGDWKAIDPFLLLMEDWFSGSDFEPHPHRGIETVTYILEGNLEYRDNHGTEETIPPGDVQWQVAGRGLVHHGEPPPGEAVHLLQLWINLPARDKLVPADTQSLHSAAQPVRREAGAEVRVFSGASGNILSSTRNHTPVTMVEITLDPGAAVEQEVPAGFRAFVLPISGTGNVGTSQAAIATGEIAWLAASELDGVVSLTAGANGLKALLFAGQPLGEPVAAHGPFVMNTVEQLSQGFAEYRATGERFGL